jgi:hypothetical protein
MEYIPIVTIKKLSDSQIYERCGAKVHHWKGAELHNEHTEAISQD